MLDELAKYKVRIHVNTLFCFFGVHVCASVCVIYVRACIYLYTNYVYVYVCTYVS